jgi:hypothetical protein
LERVQGSGMLLPGCWVTKNILRTYYVQGWQNTTAHILGIAAPLNKT